MSNVDGEASRLPRVSPGQRQDLLEQLVSTLHVLEHQLSYGDLTERTVCASGTVHLKPSERAAAIFFGVVPVRDKEAKVREWTLLAPTAALLTGLNAGGLWHSAKDGPSTAPDLDGAQTTLSRLAMSCFCATTFCFLTSSITAALYVGFANSTQRDIHDIKQVLGWAFHMPGAYFRFGYIGTVVSLSLFFVRVMNPSEMFTCLGLCVFFMVLPMCLAMGRALTVFVDDKHSYKVYDSSRKGATRGGSSTSVDDNYDVEAEVPRGSAV
jgi:hypothetical protein